jgi:hypothetical protein
LPLEHVAFEARLVQVIHLKSDEHADHDNDEVEPYCDPVLTFDMLHQAAQQHGVIPN